MRTTVRLPDPLLAATREYAASREKTLTAVFEEALTELLARRRAEIRSRRDVDLPTFSGDGLLPGVDLYDSSSLLERMDDEGG